MTKFSIQADPNPSFDQLNLMGKLRMIYGPVQSWRFGVSLGVDLLGGFGKVCSFDCVYCQLGPSNDYTLYRRVYVEIDKVIKEIRSLPRIDIDCITISGMGEPTLARNLREVISTIKGLRDEPIVILTNSSFLHIKEVRRGLILGDIVSVKLDASSDELFYKINRPGPGIRFLDILDGIKRFRDEYKEGTLSIQVMFIKENMYDAYRISDICREIGPDRIEINTPLRPSKTVPLQKEELIGLREYFKGLKTISPYDKEEMPPCIPIDPLETMKRRGKEMDFRHWEKLR